MNYRDHHVKLMVKWRMSGYRAQVELLTRVLLRIQVFWNVTPCRFK